MVMNTTSALEIEPTRDYDPAHLSDLSDMQKLADHWLWWAREHIQADWKSCAQLGVHNSQASAAARVGLIESRVISKDTIFGKVKIVQYRWKEGKRP